MPAPGQSHRLIDGPLPALRWPALDATGVVDAAVTTRHGGVSDGPYDSLNLGMHVDDDPARVVENRRRAASIIGLGLNDMVFCKQAHGREVARVGIADRGRGTTSDDGVIDGTDALVTDEPGIGLVTMVADCVPLVLVDPEARVLSCVHAGWRGTTLRVTEAAVQAMAELGANPERVVAGIGPAVSPDRYQVGEDVLEAAAAAFGDDVEQVIRPDGTGRWLFDLWRANRILLTDAGVRSDHIHLAAVDTATEHFFSDRAVRPCGRFAAIARLREETD